MNNNEEPYSELIAEAQRLNVPLNYEKLVFLNLYYRPVQSVIDDLLDICQKHGVSPKDIRITRDYNYGDEEEPCLRIPQPKTTTTLENDIKEQKIKNQENLKYKQTQYERLQKELSKAGII